MELPLDPLKNLEEEREWNEAYTKVEAYLSAYQVKNRFLLARYVSQILENTMKRSELKVGKRSVTEVALEEADREVNQWFQSVLANTRTGEPEDRLSARGRLALVLADMPRKWQSQFLTPPPWPDEFVAAMQQSYLTSGPDFQISRMQPQPIQLIPLVLQPISLLKLHERPILRMILVWVSMIVFAIWLFIRGFK